MLLCAIAAAGARAAPPADPAPDGTPALTGTVLYSDAEWGVLFVDGGGGVVLVEPPRRAALPPAAGRRVAVWGRVERVRGLPAITSADVRDLGPAGLPKARDLALPAGELRWGRLEGVVRHVREDAARTSLSVVAQQLRLELQLPAAPPRAAGPPDVGSVVRFRGVFEPAGGSWSVARVWVPGWSDLEVETPASGWEALPITTVRQVLALPKAHAGELRLRLRALEPESVRSLQLEDATGWITVGMAQPEMIGAGTWCDVRGFVSPREVGPVLIDARWRLIDHPGVLDSGREPGLAVLGRVKDVRALSKLDAARGYPVKLRAVVTFSEPADSRLFVQDESGGLFVHTAYRDLSVLAGDVVIVEGFTAPGALAPIVVEPRLTRVGRSPLPAAQPASVTRLATGADDCRRIETTGIVRSVRRVGTRIEVSLFAEGTRLLAIVPVATGASLGPELVDARLRVRAVCGTRFNWRGQFQGAELYVSQARDLFVDEPPPAPAFELPASTIADVLRGGEQERWGRRVHVQGVVLHQRPGQALYLRDDTGTVVAEAVHTQPLAAGDRVEVVGFPAAGAFAPRLEDAVVRLVGHGPPPLPVAASAGQLLGGALDAELVRVEGRLLDTLTGEEGTSLLLQVGGLVLEARADAELPGRLALQTGSQLAVEGVLLAHRDFAEAPVLRLALRGAADVRVVSRPPWWTPGRAVWAVAGLVGVLLVASGWLGTLRRQVRKQTAALRSSEERYRLLAENASDVIVTLDPELRCTYVSPSGSRQSGYAAEELLRQPFERMLSPESWILLRTALRPSDPGPGPSSLTLELEMVDKSGNRRWGETRISVLRGADGRAAGYLGVARDVTARRQAQQELARLATAVEQAAEAIVLTDPDGVILYVNPAFERITGYTAGEAVGNTPHLLRSGVHDRAFYSQLWSTIRSGRTWEGRFTNRKKDGEFFLEDASISPIRERDSGRLIGYVAVKRDVTLQVQLESHLAQNQKLEAVGRLAAGVAHDFNNVLAAILGFADLLLRKAGPESSLLPYLTGIKDAALRASGLTRQILTFSRQTAPQLRPVELKRVVEEAVRLLRALLPANVEVKTRLESHGVVAADPTQLHQVVLNLGTNAGLAMRESGGQLEIVLAEVELDAAFAQRHPPARPGRFLCLAVRDSGCGMTAEVLARVFEPFFTTRDHGEGTGMGLAVVHGIVERHGGLVTAESEPGRGATFAVYLPVVADPRPNGEAVAAQPSPDEGGLR